MRLWRRGPCNPIIVNCSTHSILQLKLYVTPEDSEHHSYTSVAPSAPSLLWSKSHIVVTGCTIQLSIVSLYTTKCFTLCVVACNVLILQKLRDMVWPANNVPWLVPTELGSQLVCSSAFHWDLLMWHSPERPQSKREGVWWQRGVQVQSNLCYTWVFCIMSMYYTANTTTYSELCT